MKKVLTFTQYFVISPFTFNTLRKCFGIEWSSFVNVVHTEIFPNVFDGRWQFIGSVQYFNSLLQSYFQF
jgi:hypothetical protein